MKRTRRVGRDWVVRGDILSRDTDSKTRRATAVHEAGHAVIGEALGERVQSLELDPVNPNNGHTITARHVRKGRMDPLSFAISTMAGHESEQVIYGRPIHMLPRGDHRAVAKLGFSPMSINTAGWLARRFVRANQKTIRRVAKALLKTGRLNRRTFLAAMGGRFK